MIPFLWRITKLNTIYSAMNRYFLNSFKILSVCLVLFFAPSLKAQQADNTPQLYVLDGVYYIDKEQNQLYTGDYREYFPNETIKLEMHIENGYPDGTYVIYFDNRKPNEIRSYKQGRPHGLWRTYNVSGQLVSEASYRLGEKHGVWRIWDDLGVMRYEMHYDNGKKTGTWFMWDERGQLRDKKTYE